MSESTKTGARERLEVLLGEDFDLTFTTVK
jgi:hypothetical protein